MYKVELTHSELIDLLQDHWDDKVYENIKEGDDITDIDVTPHYIKITIGKEA